VCEVAIVGAGPQALTVAGYLLTAEPRLAGRIAIVDPAGWLHRWARQFRRLAIDRLRSACVHHPDPDPYALLKFAQCRGRLGELHGSIGSPGTALFADFCRSLIERHDLDRALIRARATDLRPDGVITLDGRQRLRARYVVVATNPARPHIPGFAGLHSDHLDLDDVELSGWRILVVGGGMTAAGLALTAARRGATVDLMSRRHLVQRDLDVEPMWLGRALPAFHRVGDPLLRARIVRQARGGGSIPPGVRAELADTDRLRLHEDCRIESIEPTDAGFAVLANCGVLPVDFVWLATGHRVHVRNEPVLRRFGRLQAVDGLPVTDPDLSVPGTRVSVCGGLAALGVGPTARTLPGARMAAERICAAITGRLPRPAQYPV
jgi:cation diffusion facilitator CzcD-associated flavoprotein CzcO